MSTSDEVPTEDPEALRSSVNRAVRTVRREGAKAGLIHAVLDSALLFIAVNLLGALFVPVTRAPVTVIPIPPEIVRAAWNVELFIPDSFPLGIGLLAATVLAVLVFVIEFIVLYCRYTIETFESMNPTVREAFRTARDAANDGDESVMAQELFRAVLRDLQRTSTQQFVNGRRITTTVGVLLVISLGVIGASAIGLQIDLGGTGVTTVGVTEGSAGVGSGSGGGDTDVLGERTEVERGTQQRAIQLDGEEAESGGAAGGSYESSGFSVDPQEVDAVAAEYTNEAELEDSELIREYNQRIRGLEQN